MNKIKIILVIFFLNVVLFGNNPIKKANNEYGVLYKNFILIDKKTNTNINIEYPQIKGMNSLEKQNKINELIKTRAIYTFYDEDTEINNGLNLKVVADISYLSEMLISIKYSAQYYYWDTMRGYEGIYATNIDLLNAIPIDNKELFNNNLRKTLNREIFKYKGPYKSKNIEKNSLEYSYIYGANEVINDLFDKYYEELTDNMYYFDKNQLTLIVEVPSGPTATMELSSDYKNIENAINLKNKIWVEILKNK